MREFLKYCPHSLPGRMGTLSPHTEAVPFPLLEPNEVPVFLVPGMFRNAMEMLTLAQQLHQIYNGRRPVYIYNDDYLQNPEPERSDPVSSDPVVSALKKIVPFGPLPYLLIGYSDGCDAVAKAGKLLQAYGQQVRVCAIDSVSSTANNRYFHAQSISSITDLISIVNYAANLAGLPTLITLSDTEVESLSNLTVHSTLEHLALLLLEANQKMEEQTVNAFLGYLHSLKDILKNKPQDTALIDKLDVITVFLTHETTAKYGKNAANSWYTEAETVKMITHPVLAEQSHRGILRDYHAAEMALLLHTGFLINAVTVEQLYNSQKNLLEVKFKSASSKSSTTDDSDNDKAMPPLSDIASDNSTMLSPPDSPSSARYSSNGSSPTPAVTSSPEPETYLPPYKALPAPAEALTLMDSPQIARPSSPAGGQNRFYSPTPKTCVQTTLLASEVYKGAKR